MKTFASILVIIIVGIMLANAIANPAGSKTLLDGFNSFWKDSTNALLGKTS